MRRHRFDPFSFLFGAIFLTVGLTLASGASGAEAVRPFRPWPAAVIVMGLVLLAWAATRVLRPDAAIQVLPNDATEPADVPDSAGNAPDEPHSAGDTPRGPGAEEDALDGPDP